jgi:hypothetical protein
MQLTFGVNMFLATAHFILPLYWIHLWCSHRPFARIFDWLQKYPNFFGSNPPSQVESTNQSQTTHHRSAQKTGIVAYVLRLWRKCPFKLIIFLVFFSLYIQEFFPFSHWPMYANPNPAAIYLQIQDNVGRPIMPTPRYIKSSLSQVNKHFKSICKEFYGSGWTLSQKKLTKCNATLYSVMKYTPLKKRPELKKRLPLRLVQTTILMNDDNQISRQVKIVGYLDKLPPSAWE